MEKETVSELCSSSCCCCCCYLDSNEEKGNKIVLYQPEIPSSKRFKYPQAHTSGNPIVKQPSREELSCGTEENSNLLASPVTTPQSGSNEKIQNICAKPDSHSAAHSPEEDPMLRFTVYFDTTLTVYIHQGYLFPKLPGYDAIHSYVVAFLLPRKTEVHRTKLVCHTRSPVFDEVIRFGSMSKTELQDQTLVLQVYYKKNNAIEECITTRYIKLKDVNLDGTEFYKRINEAVACEVNTILMTISLIHFMILL